MNARLNIFQAAPECTKALFGVEKAIGESTLDHTILALVRLRSSQINGCAFCIDLHVKDALKAGEANIRMHMLDGWRDSPLYSDRERAALAWTEALTLISSSHAPDADYEPLREHFDDAEIAHLTLAIASINLWNRVQVGLRAVHPVEEAPAAAA